jgi:hypothetical protein
MRSSPSFACGHDIQGRDRLTTRRPLVRLRRVGHSLLEILQALLYHAAGRAGAAARRDGEILADPGYVARLAAMAVEPMVMTPEQASAFVAAEVRKWKAVAAAAKIQLE